MRPPEAIRFMTSLFLAGVPVFAPLRVPEIEVNRCVNSDWVPRFTQVIAWDWHDGSCLHVRGWMMLGDGDTIANLPSGGYAFIRADLHGPAVIYADRIRFTQTVEDPEEMDRDVVPADKRLGW